MIVYKIDVLEKIKDIGHTTYSVTKVKHINNTTLQKFRNGTTNISMETLDALCCLLKCQPSDIIEYVENEKALED